jgi:tRNA(Ile)-lysidine synthase
LLVLATAAGLDVTAMHVDHGTRPESKKEAFVVASVAEHFGARFERRAVNVERGPNLEARWRDARRGVLPADALTGHTLDDQAETVVLNLLRGSASDGLAGIAPGPTKPLLQLRRAETRAVCDEIGVDPIEDPSNVDPAFRRTRVRHELLPLMNAIAERDVAPVLARQAELLRDESNFLDALAAAIDPEDARSIGTAPPVLARRAVRRWITSPGGHPLDSAAVERVLAVARCDALACEVAGGVRVERSGMKLRVVRATA